MWPRFPLIKVFFPFSIGILYGGVLPVSGNHIILNASLIFVLIIYLFFAIHGRTIYAYRWLPGLFMLILFFMLGLGLRETNGSRHLSSNIMYESGSYCTIIGRVRDPLEEKTKSYKSVIHVYAILTDKGWNYKTGQILVYFAKTDTIGLARSGELIILRSKINAVEAPANPGQFNYAGYLSRKQISQQVYLPAGSWKPLEHRARGIRISASDLRIKTLQLLQNHASGKREFAVASAVLLGNKDWLDRDTLKDFTAAGAMHILCVSGMHVGIIYIVVNTLLAFLDRSKKTRWMKTVLILLSIWFYAMITGLSSPVLRASIMFSFMTVGRSFQRFTNIYNTLTASAILLLILNPCLLQDAGFQLSYIAVIGIVTLQPRIEKLWSPKYWILQKTWSLITVTLAAQLSILPISLFYFHKFPVYFVITNLIVIPLVTLILYTGILFLAFSSVNVLSGFLSAVLFKLVKLLNSSVHFIEELPNSVIDGISINLPETILLYGILISLGTFLLLRTRALFLGFLALLLVFSLEQMIKTVGQMQKRQIIVYQVRGQSAYDFISGKSNVFVADTALYNNQAMMDFNISGNWIKNGLQEHTFLNVGKDMTGSVGHFHLFGDGLQFIQFYDVRIALLKGDANGIPADVKPMKVNLLIISNGCSMNCGEWLELYDPELVILDASNSWKQIKMQSEMLKQQNIPFYSVPEQGAFIRDI